MAQNQHSTPTYSKMTRECLLRGKPSTPVGTHFLLNIAHRCVGVARAVHTHTYICWHVDVLLVHCRVDIDQLTRAYLHQQEGSVRFRPPFFLHDGTARERNTVARTRNSTVTVVRVCTCRKIVYCEEPQDSLFSVAAAAQCANLNLNCKNDCRYFGEYKVYSCDGECMPGHVTFLSSEVSRLFPCRKIHAFG